MSIFSKTLPEWTNAGTDPGASKKAAGWLTSEKPPAAWFNWLFKNSYDCLAELRTVADANYTLVASLEPLTVDKTYYVATTGSDSNNGTASGTPFLTIAKALSMIPKYINGANVTINIAAGNYSAQTCNLLGYYGKAGTTGITIQGVGATTILGTANIDGCDVRCTFSHIKANECIVTNSRIFYYDTVTAMAAIGISSENSSGYISACSFTSLTTAILSKLNSYVSVSGGAGTGNTQVLEATQGGTIVKMTSVTTAGTTAEITSFGGRILPEITSYFVTSNSGNNYSITTGWSLSTLYSGITFKLKINATSTGVVILKVDGIGFKSVFVNSGDLQSTWIAGGIYTVIYDGTYFYSSM